MLAVLLRQRAGSQCAVVALPVAERPSSAAPPPPAPLVLSPPANFSPSEGTVGSLRMMTTSHLCQDPMSPQGEGHWGQQQHAIRRPSQDWGRPLPFVRCWGPLWDVSYAAYKCTVQTYFWHAWPRSDARHVRDPDRRVSSQRWLALNCSTSYSWRCSWSYSWSYSWTYVRRIKTMTIFNPGSGSKGLSLPRSEYREKDVILKLSKDKIMIVSILSYDWSRLNSMLAILFL